MLEIENRTPFENAVAPAQDKEGHDYAVIVVKGAFDIKSSGALTAAETQAPVVWADEHHGEPGVSSVKYESDAFPSKKGTDVVLLGHAYAGRGVDRSVDVRLDAGALSKSARVFGDRRWCKSIGGWTWSDPELFERVPLIYERAFGGTDSSDTDPAKHGCDRRNPVGMGFCVADRKERLEGLALPNIEEPGELIRNWKDKPSPAGFGFIGRDWIPRVQYAGTYDALWQKKKCPLLPDDFDEQYYRAASPGLISNAYFRGGEPVRVINASPEGEMQFEVPTRSIEAAVWIKGKQTSHRLELNTLIIEPDSKRTVLIWRATVPCFREFLYINKVQIQEVKSS